MHYRHDQQNLQDFLRIFTVPDTAVKNQLIKSILSNTSKL